MAFVRAARLRCWPRALPTQLLFVRHISNKASEFVNSKFFQVSEEVKDAIATGRPVVALESTIYTHGSYAQSVSSVVSDGLRLD